MASNIQLLIDNTSPEIAYYPFRDTFSTPELSLGWNPYYSISGFATIQGQIGNGTSSHITSLDGAALTFQWHGKSAHRSHLRPNPYITQAPASNSSAT